MSDQEDPSRLRADLTAVEFAAARRCVSCARNYAIADYASFRDYFPRPHDYSTGCITHCLSCWLGVGPDDRSNRNSDLGVTNPLLELSGQLTPGKCIVLMPMIRLNSEAPVKLGQNAIFFPSDALIDVDNMAIRDPDPNSRRMSEHAAWITGITLKDILQHPVIAFVGRFDWNSLISSHPNTQMEYLRRLSRHLDHEHLNLILTDLQCRRGFQFSVPSA